MPSFPVSNNHYHHYYTTSIHHIDESNKSRCILLLKFLAISILIIFCIILQFSWSFVIDYFKYSYNTYYIFWIEMTPIHMFTITWITILALLTIDTRYPSHPFNTPWKYICYLWIPNAIITTIIYIAFTQVIPSFAIPNINLFGKSESAPICHILKCFDATTYWLYIYVIFPGLSPSVTFIIYAITQCIKQKYSSKNEDENSNNMELTLLEYEIDHEISSWHPERLSVSPLTSSTDPSSRGLSRAYTIGSKEIYQASAMKICVLFHVAFFMMFFMWFIFSNITLSFIERKEDFEYIYLVFLFWTSLFKTIIKRLARIMDNIRGSRNKTNMYEQKYKFSIEYFMEWTFSCLYWIWLRALIAVDLPSTKNYLALTAIHVIAETIESNMKYTECYYNVSMQILEGIDRKKTQNKFYRLIYLVFKDESGLTEWRNRLSMDVMVRFYVSIISGIVQILVFWSIGESFFVSHFEIDRYDQVMKYTAISTSVEAIHYIVTYVFLLTCYGFNMIVPFLSYVTAMNKWQIFILFMVYATFFFIFWSTV